MVFWPDIKFSLLHLSSWKRNIFCSEPTLRHSGLNCCCWHQELLWALVHVPTVPLMIQFLANMPGKAEEDSPSPWAPGPTWETGIQFSSSWFCQAQPQPVWECEESADRRFSLPFCDPTFQINTFFFLMIVSQMVVDIFLWSLTTTWQVVASSSLVAVWISSRTFKGPLLSFC